MAETIEGVGFYAANGEPGPFKPICVSPGPDETGLSVSLFHVAGRVVGLTAHIYDDGEDDYVLAGTIGLVPPEAAL